MDQFPENWASTNLYENVAEELCGIFKYLIAKTKTNEIVWKKIEHTLVKSCVEDKTLHHQGLIGNYLFEFNCQIRHPFSSDSSPINLKVIHQLSRKEINFKITEIRAWIPQEILHFNNLIYCLKNVIRGQQYGYVEFLSEAKMIREELEKMEEVPQC